MYLQNISQTRGEQPHTTGEGQNGPASLVFSLWTLSTLTLQTEACLQMAGCVVTALKPVHNFVGVSQLFGYANAKFSCEIYFISRVQETMPIVHNNLKILLKDEKNQGKNMGCALQIRQLKRAQAQLDWSDVAYQAHLYNTCFRPCLNCCADANYQCNSIYKYDVTDD